MYMKIDSNLFPFKVVPKIQTLPTMCITSKVVHHSEVNPMIHHGNDAENILRHIAPLSEVRTFHFTTTCTFLPYNLLEYFRSLFFYIGSVIF